MSWDSYIDNLIAQTKDASGNTHCDKACIIGLDGSQWTTAGHANALKVSNSDSTCITCRVKLGFIFENIKSLKGSKVVIAYIIAILKDYVYWVIKSYDR